MQDSLTKHINDLSLLEVDDVNLDGSLLYLAYAEAGQINTRCAIKRVVVSSSGVSISYPDGNKMNNYIWNNRTTYNYLQ